METLDAQIIPSQPTPPQSIAIPDFASDAICLERYESTKKRYIQRDIDNVSRAVDAEYIKRCGLADDFVRSREEVRRWAYEAFRQAAKPYHTRYPRRVTGSDPETLTVHKPSFFETIFSLGRANRLYALAYEKSMAFKDASYQLKRAYHRRDELEQWLKGMHDDSLKRVEEYVETAEWQNAFNNYPEICELAARVQAIYDERETYAQRLAANEVTPEEARDRHMAEHRIGRLITPFDGITFTGVTDILGRAYYLLTDFNERQYWLPYAQSLKPILDFVIDSYRVGESYDLRLRQLGHGNRYLKALDHYRIRFGDLDKARAACQERTLVLRTAHFDDAPIDSDEFQAMVDQLRTLAISIAYLPNLELVAS